MCLINSHRINDTTMSKTENSKDIIKTLLTINDFEEKMKWKQDSSVGHDKITNRSRQQTPTQSPLTHLPVDFD